MFQNRDHKNYIHKLKLFCSTIINSAKNYCCWNTDCKQNDGGWGVQGS